MIAALAAACVVHLLTTRAAAEPAPTLRFRESPTITSARGTVLALPPGYYVPEPAWDALDAEVRRLQDAETRLAAENASLRASAKERPPGGWGVAALVTGALAAGITLGAWASR